MQTDLQQAAGYGPPGSFLSALAIVIVVTTLSSGFIYLANFVRTARNPAARTP